MARKNRESLTVYHSQIDSPVGKLYLGATEKGICSALWRKEAWYRFIEQMDELYVLSLIQDEGKLAKIKKELTAYFAGKLKKFSVPLDLVSVSGFDKKVLEATATVEFGETISYGEVAALAGSPRGSRAAGNALSKNPVPVIIPCHRVINADGSIGGFTGGLDRKRTLLGIENISVVDPGAQRIMNM